MITTVAPRPHREHNAGIINNALNEVCNRIDLEGEFDTRMGCALQDARELLAKIHTEGLGISSMPKRWKIKVDKSRFETLKSEERFCQLVALSRAVNAMRFVQTALEAHREEDGSPQALRNKFNSFFFTCSLLYEALLLVQRLPKNFHQRPEFIPLHQILKDKTATALKDFNLKPLRNQLTFHFDEVEVKSQLAKNAFTPVFAIGEGDTNADVYFEIADACTLGTFSGLQLSQPNAEGQFGELAQRVTDLAIRFMDAADSFINKTLLSDGWELEEQPLS